MHCVIVNALQIDMLTLRTLCVRSYTHRVTLVGKEKLEISVYIKKCALEV